MITDEGFQKFAKKIRKRLRNDWDLVIAITGEEGSGKSTLALMLAQEIDPDFDLIKNVAYLPTYQEMFKKYNNLHRYGCFVVDEAVKVLHKHQWGNKLQIMLNQMYATERFQNKCSLLCIPRFWNLTENFRNYRVKIWVHVIARGHAVVYVRDDDKDTDDAWHVKENRKIKERYYKKRIFFGMNKETKLKAERMCKTYAFDFEYPDLDETLKKRYLELKEQSRKEDSPEKVFEEKLGKRDQQWKDRSALLAQYMVEKGFEQKEIGKVLGFSSGRMSELCSSPTSHLQSPSLITINNTKSHTFGGEMIPYCPKSNKDNHSETE